MHIDPNSTSPQDNYKLLTNLVVPRPIAWVTSQNSEGVINLAPFSFFNAIGSDPLYLIISIGNKDDGSLKDTAANIIARGEFVVNLVTEDLVSAMNISAANFPSEESELAAVGLHAADSKLVKVPRVAEAKASLECVLHSQQPLGIYTLIIGQVVMFHVDDALLSDRLHINGFTPIGRMGSPAYYCRTSDRFEVPRIPYENLL
jgi:flavin reductase (DIM6/NTAB) family NADH-FMN oxidoreductase RutF